jgi:hypothetical protein
MVSCVVELGGVVVEPRGQGPPVDCRRQGPPQVGWCAAIVWGRRFPVGGRRVVRYVSWGGGGSVLGDIVAAGVGLLRPKACWDQQV